MAVTGLAMIVAVSVAIAQGVPDYSGRWVLDEALSGTPIDVWGQTRASVIVVTQAQDELTLITEGGGLSVPTDLQRYRLDGVPLVFVDDSLGALPHFVRKVRTQAQWDGRILTLETEHFSESIDRRTGETVVRRGITSVFRLHLEPDGDALVVERTGFRAEPPHLLHGRPYDRKDDLVYNVDRIRYVKAG